MQRRIREKLPYFLLVACVALIVLNVVLFVKGREYYQELTRVRLDPLGLGSGLISDSEREAKSSQEGVVFVGDSRATGWFASIDDTQAEYYDEGADGQTSTQVLLRLHHGRASRVGQIIVLQVGINDLKAIPVFPEQTEAIVANLEANISAIVESFVEDGATVIVTTIFPVGKIPLERLPFWSSDVPIAIDEVNSYMFSLASESVIILDAHAILEDRDSEEDVFADELHISQTGYQALNQELFRILERLR